MRASAAMLLAAGMSLSVSANADAKAKDSRRSLALMNVTAGEGFTAKQVRTIEDVVLSALDATGRFKVIGQSDITPLLSLEQQKQAMGCADTEACMAQVAGALGVDLVATADVGKLGTTTVVSLKVVDVATATVLVRAQELVVDDNALPTAMKTLAAHVVATLYPATVAVSPPPAAPTPAARATVPVTRHTALRVVGWTGVAVGVLALAAGTALGVAVHSDQSKIKADVSPGASTESLIKSSNAQAVTADALFGAGGVLGAAGLGLVIAF